ncbi:DNA-3-methyladenine glycosylase [Nephila pilipes]|uniref:DNA-3-methyladenine glycosylase n=1 Tax=Nephila pilipes TaxID=299642 RepID=A0A8X6PSD2_NEPPI|nr:DNA-3-methyladenine glycosylase [Nephila pilipes]
MNKQGKKRTLSSRLSQKAANYTQNNIEHKALKKDTDDNPIDSEHSNVSLVSVAQENNKLTKSFYEQPCATLAKSLLGKVLVRKLENGEILRGRIVETECYLGTVDKASHSYKGKKTERNEAMFLHPGTAYVYTIYGMYFCFNISSLEEGSAVLIRALEPLQNTSTMCRFRSVKRKNSSVLKEKDLCSGPSKLCQALKIEKQFNKVDLCTSDILWLEDGKDILFCDIIACKRIGIDSAGEEWANKPLRFYIRDCIWK